MMLRNCVPNESYVFRLKPRMLNLLMIICCLGACCPTIADDYLSTELKTITGLKKVLAAQQQLLQAKQTAVQQLAADGFASKLEQTAADQSVEFNQQQQAVCVRQIKLLKNLQESNPESGQIQVVIFDPSVLIKMPSRTPFVMALDSDDQQLRKQLVEAQTSHEDAMKRMRRSVGFRIAVLKETIQKLQASTTRSGDAGGRANKFSVGDSSVEVGFLKQQLAVHEATQQLLKCRTASLRIASLPTSLTNHGRSLTPQDVVAVTSMSWNKSLLDSRQQSMLSVAKSIEQFRSPQPIQTKWLPESSQPVAVAQQANILKRQALAVAEAASGLQLKLDSLGRPDESQHFEVTARDCSELMSLFAKSQSSERQVRRLEAEISTLSSLAESDKHIEKERDWAVIKLQVLQAENKQHALMAQTVLRPLYRSTRVRRAEQNENSVRRVEQDDTNDFLASFCDGQLEQSQLDQKLAASKFAKAKQQALRQLHSEGHASWLELRNAETEVLILQEEIAAAELLLTHSKLRSQILDRLRKVENDEPTVTGI